MFGSLGIDTVLQLRIESDWRDHVENGLRPIFGDSEDNGIGFLQILSKVKNTFPDLRMLYATSDENAMLSSKNEIREACRSRFGIELLWKSDLLEPSLIGQLTPLDLSLIDFEIAKYSRRFVGLTSSTFSNMLGIAKLADTRQPVTGHYIYNRLGDGVVERKDNGFTTTSHQALSPADAVALLAVAGLPDRHRGSHFPWPPAIRGIGHTGRWAAADDVARRCARQVRMIGAQYASGAMVAFFSPEYRICVT